MNNDRLKELKAKGGGRLVLLTYPLILIPPDWHLKVLQRQCYMSYIHRHIPIAHQFIDFNFFHSCGLSLQMVGKIAFAGLVPCPGSWPLLLRLLAAFFITPMSLCMSLPLTLSLRLARPFWSKKMAFFEISAQTSLPPSNTQTHSGYWRLDAAYSRQRRIVALI